MEVVSGKLPYEGARSRALIVDGVRVEGNFIPASMFDEKKCVKVEVVYD